MTGRSVKSASSFRLRSIHPIIDTGGGNSLLYDQERTFIIQVPIPFRDRVAKALESADFDGSLADWLINEDLLTRDPARSWAQGTTPELPVLTDISFDMSGSCNLGCSYCFEKEIQSRIGPMSSVTALAALDFAFKKAAGASRLALHFGSGEPLIRFDLLQSIVAEAARRAEATGQSITYELTTNATLVTEEIAAFLRDHPFNIRVSCDGPPDLHDAFRPFVGGQSSYSAVEKGLRLLLEYMPERVTVNSVFFGRSRLVRLWAWAKDIGVRHYHVIKVGSFDNSNHGLRESELLHFREDLESVCNDLFSDIAEGRVPIDYQPITKVVRRLMIPEPITRFCGVAGSYLGVASNGTVYPCFRHLGIEQYKLGDVWNEVDDGGRQRFLGHEAADVDSRPTCRDCWARYLCGGGCYADSTTYGPESLKPQVQHCPFWRTEIELAIRFYRRLLDTDATYCLRLFGDDPALLLDSFGSQSSFFRLRNCQ